MRPADGNETAQAWRYALEHDDGPTVLALTRQNVPNLEVPAGSVARGGYVIAEAQLDQSPAAPHVILIGTGSEVSLCLAARDTLQESGIATRVVSMPSFELFDVQDAEYRESVLPRAVTARVTVEAGASLGWERYAGRDGVIIGLDRFGASAPGDVVMRELGFTVERVVAAAHASLRRAS
jgi:transketolase